MAKKEGNRPKITLACTDCRRRNYNTVKNRVNDRDRIEFNKYCRWCRKHTLASRDALTAPLGRELTTPETRSYRRLRLPGRNEEVGRDASRADRRSVWCLRWSFAGGSAVRAGSSAGTLVYSSVFGVVRGARPPRHAAGGGGPEIRPGTRRRATGPGGRPTGAAWPTRRTEHPVARSTRTARTTTAVRAPDACPPTTRTSRRSPGRPTAPSCCCELYTPAVTASCAVLA